jgi:hypothetical protein
MLEGSGGLTSDVSRENNGNLGSNLTWAPSGIRSSGVYNDSENIIDCGTQLNPQLDNWSGLTIVYTGMFVLGGYNTFPSLVFNAPFGEYYSCWSLTYEDASGAETLYFRPGNNVNGGARGNLEGKSLQNRVVTLVATWDRSSTARVYYLGKLQHTITGLSTNWGASGNTQIGGYFRTTWRTSLNTHHQAAVMSSPVSEDMAIMLTETPYALLMPVARPFIFDMAGGGGVYTIGKAGLGYSGAPLYGSLFSEIPSLTSSLSGKDAKGSTTAKPQKASLAFSGQEASTGLLTTIGRSISNFAGQSITIGIVSGTIVSVGQAVFSFVGNAAKGGIKSVIAKFGLTSSTGEVKGNTTASTPSVGFTYQGNEAKANTKATVDSKSFGLNGRGVIVNGVAEIIRRAVKIIGSSLRRIIG